MYLGLTVSTILRLKQYYTILYWDWLYLQYCGSNNIILYYTGIDCIYNIAAQTILYYTILGLTVPTILRLKQYYNILYWDWLYLQYCGSNNIILRVYYTGIDCTYNIAAQTILYYTTLGLTVPTILRLNQYCTVKELLIPLRSLSVFGRWRKV